MWSWYSQLRSLDDYKVMKYDESCLPRKTLYVSHKLKCYLPEWSVYHFMLYVSVLYFLLPSKDNIAASMKSE